MAPEPVVIEARLRDELTRPLRAVRGELNETARAAERTGRAAGGTGSAGLSRMEERSKRLHRALGDVHTRLRAVSGWVGREFAQGMRRGALAVGVIVGALATLGLKSASAFQQSRIAFETLLGSVAKGQALFGELQKLNLKTPFELGDIAPATQLLLRYGVAGERVLPVLKSLLDAAALSGNPAENLQRLSLAVGQIVQKGRVSGEEARQLAESGIDVYGLFAQKLGVTTARARELGEAGKLSSEMFLEGLVNLEGPLAKLRGGAEKMSATLMGQLSNLKDAVMVRLADAAAPLVDTLAAQIPTITAAVGAAVDAVGPPVFRLVGIIASGLTRILPALAPLLETIVTGLGRLMSAAGPGIDALAPLADEIGAALVELVNALVPVMPDLVDLFVALVRVLPAFVRLLTDLVPIVTPVIRLVTGLLELAPVRSMLAGLLAVMLGYRAVTSVVGTLQAFAGGLRGVAAAERDANSAAAGGGLGKGARTAAGIGLVGAAAAQLPGTVKGQSWMADLGFVGTTTAAGAVIGGPVGAGVGAAIGTGAVLGRRAYEAFFGDVAGNLAASSRVHALAAGMTPGRVPVTSTLRGYGLASSGSGHLRGTAWDAAPDFPHAYAGNIRRLGGFATVHDSGAGRHVHSQIGDVDPVPWSAGMPGAGRGGTPPVVIFIGEVHGQVDFERGVARAYAEARRRELERAHIDRTGRAS